MKKFVVLLTLIFAFSISLSAAESNGLEPERHEGKWSDITYSTVHILKVLEARDAYVVIYQKNHVGTGSTVIPKSWSKGTPDNPRKLKFRDTTKPYESYMTIVKKGGEFHRLILTMPVKKNNSIWGVLQSGAKIDTDKETLEELEL